MFNTLSIIGQKLNEENILWGVGASLLLNHYGLVDKPNDIDLLIAEGDIKKADEILQGLGVKEEKEETQIYGTKYFYEYTINKIGIDVMAGFRINTHEGTFKYIFDEKSVVDFTKINGVSIPLMALEDWYIIYQLIPGRQERVKMVGDYLLAHGIRHRELLERTKALSPRRLEGVVL